MRRFLEQWERLTIEATHLESVGDTVFAHVVQHGKGRASGIGGDTTYFMLFTFRAGKNIRIDAIVDEAEAREAAGLEHSNAATKGRRRHLAPPLHFFVAQAP
jgi:ketosteroid isomerase-like protein